MADEYGDEAYGLAPTGEQKHNVHTFLFNVAKAENTTKTGNLTVEELGTPKIPLRTYKELALFCRDVMNQDEFSDYFDAKGEIMTATSLSKEALLLKLAITQEKRETIDMPRPKAENKSWFKKKNKNLEQQGLG